MDSLCLVLFVGLPFAYFVSMLLIYRNHQWNAWYDKKKAADARREGRTMQDSNDWAQQIPITQPLRLYRFRRFVDEIGNSPFRTLYEVLATLAIIVLGLVCSDLWASKRVIEARGQEMPPELKTLGFRDPAQIVSFLQAQEQERQRLEKAAGVNQAADPKLSERITRMEKVFVGGNPEFATDRPHGVALMKWFRENSTWIVAAMKSDEKFDPFQLGEKIVRSRLGK